jgi:hypothetical protein
MPISFKSLDGGSANDFVLDVGGTSNNTYNLSNQFPSGVYSISTASGDSSYDVYLIGSSGNVVGYSKTASIIASADFVKVVILGLASSSERIFFVYTGLSSTASEAGLEVVAGAYITSVVTASLPNINDTTIINGGNFASNVEVVFIGQNASETSAKSIVRSSSTQLIVTRPDSFSVSNSPYSIRVTNPGVQSPTGSNVHILSNAVTAGTLPSWITGSSVNYNLTNPTSITLLANDTEASDIDYTIVSGTLPAGLSLNTETGVITGTFSGSASEGQSTAITFRATDAGGNFVDKSISLVANESPVWTTSAGELENARDNPAYSFQLVASSNSVGGSLTYTLQSGTLPVGLSLSSSGLISGTTSEVNLVRTFTVRATDQLNAFTDRQFSISTQPQFEYLVVAGGGGGGDGWNAGAGGGGAGGYRTSRISIPSTTTSFTVTVGAGGAGKANGNNSRMSLIQDIISIGGGAGSPSAGSGGVPGNSGGSGGGGGPGAGSTGAGIGGAGTPGQGNNGGNGATNGGDLWSGGGGGGAGAVGGNPANVGAGGVGGAGLASSITGTSVFRAGGGGGNGNGGGAGGVGGGGAKGVAGTANTGGGGGGVSMAGGSGIVILRYPSSNSLSVGGGLTSTTSTIGDYKVTTFTAGTGTVTWN